VKITATTHPYTIMKKQIVSLLSGLLISNLAFAQVGADTVVPVVPPTITPTASVTQPAGDTPAPDFDADAPINPVVVNRGEETPAADTPTAGAGAEVGARADVAVNPDAAVVVDNSIEEGDGGFLIKDASINDIFQLLSKRGGKQYFHNNKLNTDDFKVTGHLNGDASPMKQMEELAFQYGLRMYVKGNTVYAMLDSQLEKLPAKQWTYSLNYLRPTDIEQIKALVQPMLTPGRGVVNFEPKTNTIVVIDTVHHIEMVEELLSKIDKAKGQVVVEVKILRINSTVGQQVGVDWTTSLGQKGVTFDMVKSLGSVFGLATDFSGALTGGGGREEATVGQGSIILSPIQLSGVLRALNDGNLVTQKSNPIVVTEDNEKAIISLIDRVPIITSTTNSGGSSGNTTTTDQVRYKIDESDSTDPDKTREIGVTISLTPSLLPDGTIRMHMRPRNAQIVENVTGPSGNTYPRVSEATIESVTRIPDGHSLIVGGFYGALKSNKKTKVSLLGDVPIFKFFFKSKQTSKEQSSLVFVVTPTSYDPSCVRSNSNANGRVRNNLAMQPGHESVDDTNPGPAHESNMRRTIRGFKSHRATKLPQR
jgi:type II secretory pathway component GspD/PulD (secretin)